VPGVSGMHQAGWRHLRLALAGALAVAALALTGCGEKSEPEVHPPTTAPTTVPPATTTTPTATNAVPTPTATAPKQP
jgi:hypothetical protein